VAPSFGLLPAPYLPPPLQAVFAPSVSAGRLVATYDSGITSLNTNMLKAFNDTLGAYKAAVDANQVPTLTQQNWADYNSQDHRRHH
jgi:hypothetical protein